MRVNNRFRAGFIHLLCSSSVAAVALLLIYKIWHPGALSELQGVDQLVIILIAVDMTLGPFLTLVVYDTNKTQKTIRTDLSTIAFFQIVALVFGLNSIFQSRPVYIVFNVDRFDVVVASQVDKASLERAIALGHEGMPLFKPKMVFAELPDDIEKRNDILFSALDGGPDLAQMPEWYSELGAGTEAIKSRLRPIDELARSNDLDGQEWRTVSSRWPHSIEDLGYVPVLANSRDGSAIFERSSGRFLEISTLLPMWTFSSDS